MGSINDYNRSPREHKSWKKFKLPGRTLTQIVLSLAFFLLVAGSITADNWLGDGARYVMEDGLDSRASWLNFGSTLPAMSDSNGSEDNNTQDEAELPAPTSFLAPASGVVVKDVTTDETGLAHKMGINIRGTAGQEIIATAAGKVSYLGNCDSGYIVEITHGGGYTTAYQGLSELSVAMGDTVNAGDKLGKSTSGELLFTMRLNDEEVDPLEYLF